MARAVDWPPVRCDELCLGEELRVEYWTWVGGDGTAGGTSRRLVGDLEGRLECALVLAGLVGGW